MPLSPEEQKELEQFPTVLRQLIEEELTAGNEVDEIGHSFPAPPVGAYFKLKRKVSTRPRESGGGLNFYERNGSQYSGQFTDAKAFFFVLEPPDPPPEEIDMDALRQTYNAPCDREFTQPAESRTSLATDDSPDWSAANESNDAIYKRWRYAAIPPTAVGSEPFVQTTVATGQSWLIYVDEVAAPYEVKEELERRTNLLFETNTIGDQMIWRSRGNCIGVNYTLELVLLITTRTVNRFSLRIDADWSHLPADNESYFKHSSAARVDMWTNVFRRLKKPTPLANDEQLYALWISEANRREESQSSVVAIQQLVVDGFRHGSVIGRSHKEGGTRFQWTDNQFVRIDYGDYPNRITYKSDAEFLDGLLQFCQFDVCGAGNSALSQLDTWKLILRNMAPILTQ